MIPSVGRIVLYTLTPTDVEQINRRRADGLKSGIIRESTGAVVHYGNEAREGDVLPLVIVKVWLPGSEASAVNGQLLLDGNDTLWKTSVSQSQEPKFGSWHVPPRA